MSNGAFWWYEDWKTEQQNHDYNHEQRQLADMPATKTITAKMRRQTFTQP